jgi:hypothetical protein
LVDLWKNKRADVQLGTWSCLVHDVIPHCERSVSRSITWQVIQAHYGGNFSEPEIQILLLTDAVTNSCTWALAFHSALALQQGIDRADVRAIRERRLPVNTRYAALSRLARTLIEQRGHLKIKI